MVINQIMAQIVCWCHERKGLCLMRIYGRRTSSVLGGQGRLPQEGCWAGMGRKREVNQVKVRWEECSWQREYHVQRPWGRKAQGLMEKRRRAYVAGVSAWYKIGPGKEAGSGHVGLCSWSWIFILRSWSFVPHPWAPAPLLWPGYVC